MKKIGTNSIEFNNVYLRSCSAVSGPKEGDGPYGKYFDYSYKNNYIDQESWEQGEIKLQQHSIDLTIEKAGMKPENIDLIVGGDLNNQLAITNYAVRSYPSPYLGVFAACSTCTESMIVASTFIDGGYGENALCVTSSHNCTSERQFRYPTEYGGQKPNSMTSTATGAGSCIISNIPSGIKISRCTIGKIVDPELMDSQDMGRAMAPAATSTFLTHLNDFNISPNEYDLILTGDLSKYGSDIFRKIVLEYGITNLDNYNDAGVMLYDLEKQDVFAGGSGCGCVTLMTFSYVVNALRTGLFNKVLIIATGALMNPIMVAQNETIPSIAHAVVLERSQK